jgi:5'/3'-nucleotidase
MNVLVTNDDGVDSPGLHTLARALVDDGHEVIVVAPAYDTSGAGASLGVLHADGHIDTERVELPGLPDVPAYALDGPPGRCVITALRGAFGPRPDLVVSGINPGANTGRAVLHSGTVGGALTAANFGVRALAVSIDAHSSQVDAADILWETAADTAAALVAWLAATRPATVLNVNVPNLPPEQLAGAREATLAGFGTVQAAVAEPAPDGGRIQMQFTPVTEDLPPDSDTALVKAGYVAVSAITGIQLVPDVDVRGALEVIDPEARRSA